MAASLLKCGINRVWIDPNRLADVMEAITRKDIKGMIKSGAIQVRQKKGVSRGRVEYIKSQKKKGRRKGHGSRKGTANARTPKKKVWQQNIRNIRRFLKELRDAKKISTADYRIFYRHAKGGVFKSKSHLEARLKEKGIL
jgi:large subunit ribosomal protein L19e